MKVFISMKSRNGTLQLTVYMVKTVKIISHLQFVEIQLKDSLLCIGISLISLDPHGESWLSLRKSFKFFFFIFSFKYFEIIFKLTKNWPTFYEAAKYNLPMPTWEHFLSIVAEDVDQVLVFKLNFCKIFQDFRISENFG